MARGCCLGLALIIEGTENAASSSPIIPAIFFRSSSFTRFNQSGSFSKFCSKTSLSHPSTGAIDKRMSCVSSNN